MGYCNSASQKSAETAEEAKGSRMRLITTVADHPEYSAGLYVLVRLLRHLGCSLPVQCWHDEDRPNDPVICAALENLGTSFHPLPGTRAFHAKCFPAIWPTMAGGSAEVLYLDSDCYPVRNPEEVFDWPAYRRHGALFWPNFRASDPSRWRKLGMEAPAEPEFETGQYVVDLSRCREAMERGHRNCNDPRIFGPVFRDDQECLHLAFIETGTPYDMIDTLPRMELHTIINHDIHGSVFTQHRVADKFRLKNWSCFWTHQRSDEMIRHRVLVNEDLHFGFFDEFAALVGHDGPVPGFPWCAKCGRRQCRCRMREVTS